MLLKETTNTNTNENQSNNDMIIPSSVANLKPEIKERFRQILLNITETLDDPQEDAVCTEIVQRLSTDEMEDVARISYAYWALSLLKQYHNNDNGYDYDYDDVTSPKVARKIAKKVALWHLQYLTGDTPSNSSKYTDATLKRLREAIQLRKERNMELFRSCFDDDVVDEISLRYQRNVTADLKKQMQFYRGQDVEGRAILLKIPRIVGGATEEEYFDHQLYVAERAAAVTEFISNGRQETICAIFSMKNQDSSLTPSLSWFLTLNQLLQKLYPGRIKKVVILDAPFMVRKLFNFVRPFLSKPLKESTVLVAGKSAMKKQLEEILGETTSENQDIFTSDGKLKDPVDIDRYLKETPFFCPYDYAMHK